MGKRVCLRCQTSIPPGTDYCSHCGLEVGHLARNIGWRYRFAAIGGKRRKPGELSTFAKLKWLPFALAIVMMGMTLAAVPGLLGSILAPVIATIALATCSVLQARMVLMAKEEAPGTPVCPHCFAEYEIGDDFCPKCGKPVGDATSTMPFIPPPGEDFEDHSDESSDSEGTSEE